MKIRPLHDRVVVRVREAEKKTASGIVIPDNAQEKPTIGTVLSVGPGRYTPEGTFLATAVKEGDTVMFGKFAGQTVKVDSEDLTVLKEEDIFAIVN